MKSLLISIKPIWCAKIMNGEKTIEVRKNKTLASAIQKLIDENGYAEIYVYCSKGKERLVNLIDDSFYCGASTRLNGKVVFKFRCYKVEEITTEKWSPSKEQDLLKASCLTENQLFDYCNLESGKPFYAIHISKLEIFDQPKELIEFKYWKDKSEYGCCYENKLTKAPQNMVYIEVTENE